MAKVDLDGNCDVKIGRTLFSLKNYLEIRNLYFRHNLCKSPYCLV